MSSVKAAGSSTNALVSAIVATCMDEGRSVSLLASAQESPLRCFHTRCVPIPVGLSVPQPPTAEARACIPPLETAPSPIKVTGKAAQPKKIAKCTSDIPDCTKFHACHAKATNRADTQEHCEMRRRAFDPHPVPQKPPRPRTGWDMLAKKQAALCVWCG